MAESLPLAVPASFEACTENLISETLALGKDLQAKFAQEFFQSLLGLHLNLEQSLDAWQCILEQRAKLTTEKHLDFPFRRAVLEYFLRSPFLREPIITEFSEFQRLRLTSTIDHLTGTHNRRFFDISLDKEIKRAVRYNVDLSLVLIDLNRFKEVNDFHGHATGDKLLALTGKLLVDSARVSDYAFRIGGDEFALLLPQTAHPSATLFAERLCQRFPEAVRSEGLEIGVSMGYGVATSPREATEAKTLFDLADRRLYDSKRLVGTPRCSARRFERLPVKDIGAYVIVNTDSHVHRGQLIDFSMGGIGLRVPSNVRLPESFDCNLHLQVLPPVPVSLQKVYVGKDSPQGQRLGCAFLRPNVN